MVHFLDGPAAGQAMLLRRAPLFLRVVRGKGPGGADRWDALDLPKELPAASELPYAYRRVDRPRRIHIDFCGREKSRSGWYEAAEYRFVPRQPPRRTMRFIELWEEWATVQHANEKAEATA